ncbi:hypothetical protein F1880_007757 [Penicillium rolfsii]|nr:hypothetical protein F1880_007757 [Penicillium rolfsii]
MPIEALPQATVRAIGSTSVISDACSVVKELLDNALDASASSVLVEISQNTVDVIQVKDNGHGISAEDHPCVCKHTFTSKISSIDDLRNVGGTSLGFRGEALASVAEMSGSVNIVTRVASDVVASSLEYGRDGELSRTQKTSHPIGTTVRIQNFLKYIPVRRQAALKGATKCLAKIKSLIQAYALAQPSKKFSFKVLKVKNENSNWLFAPCADSSLFDAAVKVVGRDVASCCTTRKSTPGVNSINDGNLDPTKYQVTAFLPRVDADFTKVNKKGQFLSVDGRPLSTSRGAGLDMVKLFKCYIRATALKINAARSVSDPFLCLQLKCPVGSYDVNIEPGKDDVLFEEREIVFSLIENLIADHYGALPDAVAKSPAKKAASINAHENNAEFELLMARRPPENLRNSPKESNLADASDLPNLDSRTLSGSPGVPSPEQTPSRGCPSRELHNNPISGRGSSRQINPWSISRINASFQAPSREVAPVPALQASPAATPQESRQRNAPQGPTSPSPPQISLLSPVLSRLTPVSPLSRRSQHQTPHESSVQSIPSIIDSRRAARERDKERYGNGALDTWFQRTTQQSLARSHPEALVDHEEAVQSLSQLAEQRFSLPQDVPLIALPRATGSRSFTARPLREQTPDPSPQEIGGVVSPGNEHQGRSMDSGRGFPVLENWAASIHEGFTPETSFELEKALDFERRKREANQRHRSRSGRSTLGLTATTSNSPHRNRYLAAKAALTTDSVAIKPPATALAHGDPRAYLISIQTDQISNDVSKDPGIGRRGRTSRLPLERIPEGLDLHNVCLPVKASPSEIRNLFNMTAHHDGYTRCGDEPVPSLVSDVTAFVPSWNQKLTMIISECYKTQDNSQPQELSIDVGTAIADLEKQFRATESQSA